MCLSHFGMPSLQMNRLAHRSTISDMHVERYRRRTAIKKGTAHADSRL
jgi:hypothetical protein